MRKQFVVQLPNRPGELAHLARALAARWINIEHIASVGHGSLACAFLTTSDPAATLDVLHGLGYEYFEGTPVIVDVEDNPGGLAKVSGTLAEAGVNILAALIVGRRPGILEMAFSVDDDVRAREVLGLSPTAVAGV